MATTLYRMGKKKSELAAGGDGENTDTPTTDFRLTGRAFLSQNVDDGFHELECVFMTRPNVAAHWLLRVGALTPARRRPQRAAQPSNGGATGALTKVLEKGGQKGGAFGKGTSHATPSHKPHLLYWCPRAASVQNTSNLSNSAAEPKAPTLCLGF